MGTHRLIYIRTDGNSRIASGHLMRCFSIALACRQLGMKVHFLVSDKESLALLKDIMTPYGVESFTISQLQTASYNRLEEELPEVAALLVHMHNMASPHYDTSVFYNDTIASCYDGYVVNQKPVYFLDSYYVTEAYLSALRPYAKIAYLDDLRLFDYPVDLLINYDVIPDSEMASYKASYQKARRLLLGAAYTPLRIQFQNRQIHIKKQVENILITTGGSDPFHFCLAFARRLEASDLTSFFSASRIGIHIVIGKLNTDRNSLCEYTERLSFLHLHENVTNMAALMLDCDLAVSAAGTTLYELCALGIPAISFTMADNQQTAAKTFEAADAIPCAGDLRDDLNKVLEKIILFITNNSKDAASNLTSGDNGSYNRRKQTQKAMKALVDGSGAARIAKAVSEL